MKTARCGNCQKHGFVAHVRGHFLKPTATHHEFGAADFGVADTGIRYLKQIEGDTVFVDHFQVSERFSILLCPRGLAVDRMFGYIAIALFPDAPLCMLNAFVFPEQFPAQIARPPLRVRHATNAAR